MNLENEQSIDVLVMGAGMAGLSAAAALQRAGREVVVIDKGRGVGGRMATRRIGSATFDHGAQFVTSRDERFATVLAQAQTAGAAQIWCHGFNATADGHPRWRGTPGMSALAKHLAVGLHVRQERAVTALSRVGDQWRVQLQDGESLSARALILTAPVPQSLTLLRTCDVLSTEMETRLSAIDYARCLAVLALLDGPSGLADPGGFAPASGPISWLADNQIKGVSTQPALTMHATDEFSIEHWDHDRNESGQLLLNAAAEWVSSSIKSFHVHGWRYSKPLQVDPSPCAVISHHPPLVLAGDAFAGPRLEGAALSGWAAAQAVLEAAG